jgi:formylglycine-generating enzyme required for sulfatase activity
LKPPIYVEDDRGARRVEASEFPLALGGPDADIRLAGARAHVAYVGLSQGELFVQPAHADLPVLCNGTPLKTSQWLRDGDVVRFGMTEVIFGLGGREIRIHVEERKAAHKTDPPVIAPTNVPGAEIPGVAVKPVTFEPVRIGADRRERRSIRPRELALWSCLLLLAAAAWFVFTARSVLVETDPSGAQIDFSGSLLALELGGRYLLRPGVYTIVVEKDGYRRLEAEVAVTDQRNQTLRFILEKRPGLLVISTVPEEGAMVSIDGEEIGVTPLSEVELSAGEHEVFIRAERYKDFLARVNIEGAGTTATLNAELEPRWAAVTFTSEPAGATVEVSGMRVGATPVTTNLMEGAHAYRLTLRGHKPYRNRLAVVAGEPQTLQTTRLDLVDGMLALQSVPSGASVTVDGVYRGETPLELNLEPGELHQIEVSHVGYEPQSHQTQIQSGNQQTMSVELVPILGELEIVSDPPDAVLYVNGEARGSAKQVLRLIAVPQQIEVRKDGYETFTTTVTPRPGFPQSIEVILKTLEEAKRAATPSVIRTSQGHELRLIEPGRFRMGASRREPGRRANETIREVELTRRFYLAAQEVTNRQFREFNSKHRSGRVAGLNLEIDHHPVVRVTWSDAASYCNWLSQQESLPPAYVAQDGKLVAVIPPTMGYRLPTEAEWTRAARYPEGDAARKYPWGDSLPVAANSGNYADTSAGGVVPITLPSPLLRKGSPRTRWAYSTWAEMSRSGCTTSILFIRPDPVWKKIRSAPRRASSMSSGDRVGWTVT